MKLSQLANVCYSLVLHDTSFIERVQSVLNYSHTFVEQYGLASLRVRKANIAQDMTSPDFPHGISVSTDRQYLCVLKVIRRLQRLPDTGKNLNGNLHTVSAWEW